MNDSDTCCDLQVRKSVSKIAFVAMEDISFYSLSLPKANVPAMRCDVTSSIALHMYLTSVPVSSFRRGHAPT